MPVEAGPDVERIVAGWKEHIMRSGRAGFNQRQQRFALLAVEAISHIWKHLFIDVPGMTSADPVHGLT